MHEEFRNRVLAAWSRLVSRRPRWVLFIASVAAVASISVTLNDLRFQSDRNQLISNDLEWNRRFIDWRSSFVGKDDLTIVVDTYRDAEPSPEHRVRAERLVDDLAAALQADVQNVHEVVWGFDSRSVTPKALRTLNWEQFEKRVGEIERARALLASDLPTDLLAEIESRFQPQAVVEAGGADAESIQGLTRVLAAFDELLRMPAGNRPDLRSLIDPGHTEGSTWQYLESQPDGRLLFLRVAPQIEPSKINALGGSIRAIRQLMDDVRGRHPNMEFGLTGLEVVEADETAVASRDSVIASVAAFLAIAVLLISAFHSWRTPLLALLSLLFGIAWTFGYLTLVVGHLQVISFVFCVILLGLGIAYGIHIASRFELVRHQYPDGPDGFEAALEDSITTMGPGIVTGAVTTAAAFVTTAFTDFRGVGEMGLIAAGGIMLCLLSMFSVFPALLRLFKSKHKHSRPMSSRHFHFFEERWVNPFVLRPRLTMAVAVALTVLSLIAISRMRFDYDLMALQPRGVESVAWQQRIAHHGGRSIFAAVCIVQDVAQAHRVTNAVRSLKSVKEVGGAGVLFPEDDDRKCERLDEAREHLQPFMSKPLSLGDAVAKAAKTNPALLVERVESLRHVIGTYGRLARFSTTFSESFSDLSKAADHLLQTLSTLGPAVLQGRVAQLDVEYNAWQNRTTEEIRVALDTSPLRFEDLPQKLMSPYRDVRSRLALEIYPDNQRLRYESPLNPDFMSIFMADLEQVIDGVAEPAESIHSGLPGGLRETVEAGDHAGDKPAHAVMRPVLTGPMVQFYRSGQLILDSYRLAGVLALVVVFVLVLFDFQRLSDALLALIPVGVGFTVTFGLMWLLGMSVNPANIIVLPLMFGIGVDSGVHVLHRFRQDHDRRPLGLTNGTGKGITVTSLTAMIGFGSLMFARHRGIFSLGLVMALGIGMTMIACLVLMPAWLELRRQAKSV